MNIDPDLALAVFAAARRGIELEKQLSDCRRLIGITDDAPLVEALRLYIAESDEQEEANKQLGCFRAKAEEEMSQSEQETVNVATCKARGDAEPDSGGATVAPEGQIIKAVVPTSICPGATITMDLKTDAPESGTAGLLEKINELGMTTARNDTRQEIHRHWLYECRDLLFGDRFRAALADITAKDLRILALNELEKEKDELIDLHENEIAMQRDELKGLRGLVTELGKDLLERQRLQSEQAAECERLLTGIILIWRIYLKRTTHLGRERKSGLQKECIACICALLTGQSVDGKATIEELHEALAAKPAPEPKL